MTAVIALVGYFGMVSYMDASRITVEATVRGWTGQQASVGEAVELGAFTVDLKPGDKFGPTGSPLFADQPFRLVSLSDDETMAIVAIHDSLAVTDDTKSNPAPEGGEMIGADKTCFRNTEKDQGIELCLAVAEN